MEWDTDMEYGKEDQEILKNSKDKIDTLEKSVHELSMTVAKQKKDINRVLELEAKVVHPGATGSASPGKPFQKTDPAVILE